jgi:hypothetical protein
MAGMYPDDRMVEIFGEQIMYFVLDPKAKKFTDGDFSDPLIKPSHIPAETFNLILDNLGNLISAMGLEPNNTDPEQLKKAMQRGFPIGSGYLQGINDPDPIGKGLPGHWDIRTGRAEAHRLTLSALPAFTPYVPGSNIAANTYRSWHLPGSGHELWKAKAAITNAAE